MRSTINISLPRELVIKIDEYVAIGEFASRSEFMRHLVRLWTSSEELEESRREIEKSNKQPLESLKNFRNTDENPLL